MKIRGDDSGSDGLVNSDDLSGTSEDEMDGRTLQEILSDSKKKKAALAAVNKKLNPKAPKPKKNPLSSSTSDSTLFATTPSTLAKSSKKSSSSTFMSSLRSNLESTETGTTSTSSLMPPPSTSSSSFAKTSSNSINESSSLSNNLPVSLSLSGSSNSQESSNPYGIENSYLSSSGLSSSSFSSGAGLSSSSSFSGAGLSSSSSSSGAGLSSSSSSSVAPYGINSLKISSVAVDNTPVYLPGHVFLRDVKLHETVTPGTDLFGTMFESLDLEDKNDMDFINQTLWSLFALMAFDSVASTMSRTNTWDANLLHVAKFEQLLTNLRHMSHIKSNVLDHLPDNELPAFFFDFLLEIKDSKPSKKFTDDGMKISRDQQTIQISHFGSRIWNRADEVRRFINGNINPLWVVLTKNKSGSGHNFNAVIEGIRRCTWPMEAIVRATNNTKTARSRIRLSLKKNKAKPTDILSTYTKASTTSNPHDDLDNQDDTQPLATGGGGGEDQENDKDMPDFKELYVINFKKVYNKVKINSYYPSYWLSFLILGRAAGRLGRPPLEAG